MVDELFEDIELIVSGRDLKNTGLVGKSDPMCIVYEW